MARSGVFFLACIAMWSYNDAAVSLNLEYRHKLLVVSCISVITAECNTALKSLGLGSLVLGSPLLRSSVLTRPFWSGAHHLV